MIAFSCAHCGRGFQVPDASAGQAIRCGKCKATLRVPRTALGPPAAIPIVQSAARQGPAPMPASPPDKPRRVRGKGLPAWAWAAIIAGVILLAGFGSLIVRTVR